MENTNMKPLNRRLFLEEALRAASVAAVVPSAAVMAAESAGQSKSPNERLSVAVIGVRGRGGDHAHAYAARKDLRHPLHLRRRYGRGRACGGAVRKQAQVRFGHAADLRRPVGRRCLDRHAQPLAFAGRHLGDAGRQGRVRRKTGEPQHQRRPAHGPGLAQVQPDLPGRNPAPFRRPESGGCASIVREGKLGEIKLAHVCTYRRRLPIGPAGEYSPPPTVDYNLWAGPAPMELPVRRKSFHYDWHWFWDWGNGELGNNSIHVRRPDADDRRPEGAWAGRAELRRPRGHGERLRRDAQRPGHDPRLRCRSPSSRKFAISRPPARYTATSTSSAARDT